MKLSGIVLLGVAAILLVWGLEASGSIPSDVTRLIRSGPTESTVWILVGSAVAGVMGLGFLYSSRTRGA
jgi:hypothetical protein